jgi:transposase, IS30 family
MPCRLADTRPCTPPEPTSGAGGAALIEKDVRLQTFVVDRLAEGWSPEQIAGWLKSAVERGLRAIGCETIYAFIYRAGQKPAELWRYLARRRKRRRPLRARPARDLIKDRASIHERPTIVDARDEARHWEADLTSASGPGPCLPCMSANRA